YEEYGDYIGDNGYFSMIFDFRYADLDVASGSEWFKRLDWSVKDFKDLMFKSQLEIQKVGWGANFIENHDQNRAISKYIKNPAMRGYHAATMLGAMYFFLRGTPFIYQGQELGMSNFERESIDQFNDISSIDQYYRAMNEGLSQEEALATINYRSRDNSRTPFHWDATTQAGFTDADTPWLELVGNHKEINAENQLQQPDSLFHFYRQMIEIRQSSDALIYGEINPLFVEHPSIVAYERTYGNDAVLCCFNFSEHETSIPLEEEFECVLANYKTHNQQNNTLILRPYEAIILKK
ncbi:MAG: alpha-amylase family glycosyl hydrolase, partial [Bacilli bacterium]